MSTDYVLERNPQKCHNDKSGNNIHFVLAYSEEIESAPTMTDIHRSEDEEKQKFPYAKRFSKFVFLSLSKRWLEVCYMGVMYRSYSHKLTQGMMP